MLKTRLLHPQILEALGEAGHGARVLIADGNYPLATQSNPAGRACTSTSPRAASASSRCSRSWPSRSRSRRPT